MKETGFRLRLLRQCGLLTSEQDPVILESDELVRMLAALIRKDEARR